MMASRHNRIENHGVERGSRTKSPAPLFFVLMLSTGCSRAPSFDIFGSLFPAWLFCLAIGLALTGVTHWISLRARIPLAVPILTYPSLIVMLTFGLWLAFFR